MPASTAAAEAPSLAAEAAPCAGLFLSGVAPAAGASGLPAQATPQAAIRIREAQSLLFIRFPPIVEFGRRAWHRPGSSEHELHLHADLVAVRAGIELKDAIVGLDLVVVLCHVVAHAEPRLGL